MDLTLIASATSAVSSAFEIGRAAIGVRDAQRLSSVVSEMNEKLLDAQQSLFIHGSQLTALQQEYFQATKELTEIKEAIAERGNYTLVGIGGGFVGYRVDAPPEAAVSADPGVTHGEYYLCQICFDGPGQRKVVLQPLWGGWLGCPVCRTGPAIANAPAEAGLRR